jgi:hypothetical protein
MTEQEEQALARRVADGSSVFDFDKALELVRLMPAEAEKLLRDRETWRNGLDELARSRSPMRITVREFR